MDALSEKMAAARLRESSRYLGQIAYKADHESEDALSRAFRNAFGTTPGNWR